MPRVSSPQHLLVDGSNVVHAWPGLRALLKKEKAAAQAQLVDELTALHDHLGLRVTIVFDGSGPELDVVCPGAHPTFAVVRTPSGMSGDSFIESWVGRASVAGDCCVATADAGIGRTVEALGARWIRPDELAAWLARTEARLGANLAGRSCENDRNWARRS